jgi:hypothetical protein
MPFSASFERQAYLANPFISGGNNSINASLYFSRRGTAAARNGLPWLDMKAKLITARKYRIDVQGNMKWVVLL